MQSINLTVDNLNGMINILLVQNYSTNTEEHYSAAETPFSDSQDAKSTQDCQVKDGYIY